jgi:hypothetical protein
MQRDRRQRLSAPTPGSKDPGEPLQGDGVTMILEQGPVFERAGCRLLARARAQAAALGHAAPARTGRRAFEAMGVSLVFHPRNPYAPTVHMNVRMLAACRPTPSRCTGSAAAWTSRRITASTRTPSTSTRSCRDALAPFGDDKYPRFKQWCDDYFFLKHRNEQRGIGGIFFDDLAELGFERSFALMQSVGDAFLDGLPAHPAAPQGHLPYGERERDWQLLPARPLRRVQPGVGPRHALRPAVGRPHRIHPDVDAAAGSWAYRHEPSPARPRRAAAAASCNRGTGFEHAAQRVGMFGGAFDPAAPAHVALARPP